MRRGNPGAGRRHRAGRLWLLAAGLAMATLFAVAPSVVGAGPVTGSPKGALRQQFVQRYVGKPAPDFTLTDTTGKEHHLGALKGKVVLLNFWYSSCTPCRRETPDLSAIYRAHAKNGLEILGINLDDLLMPTAGHLPLQQFLDEFKPPYPILMADEVVFEQYGGIPVQPISFLVGRDGKVAKLFWGAYPGAAFEQGIAEALGVTTPRPATPGAAQPSGRP